jgi:hypothetical protein
MERREDRQSPIRRGPHGRLCYTRVNQAHDGIEVGDAGEVGGVAGHEDLDEPFSLC